MSRTIRSVILASAALALAACGGGQTHANLFGTDWEDDGGKEVAALRAKLAAAKPPANADVVVAVAGNNDKVVGLPLGGTKWSFAHAVDVRPTVAGSVVVGEGGGELFALEAATGKKLWSRAVGPMTLHGAGDDGKTTVVTLGQSSGQGSLIVAIDRDGSVARQIETEKVLGVPAIVAGHVFVPWASQYVSVIDLTSGDESARILFRGKVSHAFASGGELWFGESDTFRFDDKIAFASKNGATKLSLPQRELPGTPMLRTPGEDRVGPIALAIDKTKLYARPGVNGWEGGRFFGTYFRIVMGFESEKGALSWVWNTADDLVGGGATPDAFVACDEAGKVTVLSAQNGGVAATMDFGEPIKSCVVAADGYHAPAPQSSPALATQIAAALLNRDAEMTSGQRLLLREMSTLEDELATKTLVELASDPRTAPPLVADARAALAGRRNGATYMLDALARHYDFLKDVLVAPPVGPMAQALGAMKEKAAAPLLAAHLLDPADTEDDAKQSAAALVELGGPAELPALKEFFGIYRASHEGDVMASAVVSAAQAIVKIGGADGRKFVDAGLADPMVPDAVKARVRSILEAMDQQAKSAGTDPKKPAPDPKKPDGKK
jgi:outer membrane protein assembly factor BamB